MTRTYSDLRRMRTLEERFNYLSLGGTIGESTFGFDRWVNQQFYRSSEWRQVRDIVIARDDGFELGDRDTPIRGDIFVHHMNPLTMRDFEESTENLLDPEVLVCAGLHVHNAIHFGDISLLPQPFVERVPNDTIPWRS